MMQILSWPFRQFMHMMIGKVKVDENQAADTGSSQARSKTKFNVPLLIWEKIEEKVKHFTGEVVDNPKNFVLADAAVLQYPDHREKVEFSKLTDFEPASTMVKYTADRFQLTDEEVQDFLQVVDRASVKKDFYTELHAKLQTTGWEADLEADQESRYDPQASNAEMQIFENFAKMTNFNKIEQRRIIMKVIAGVGTSVPFAVLYQILTFWQIPIQDFMNFMFFSTFVAIAVVGTSKFIEIVGVLTNIYRNIYRNI